MFYISSQERQHQSLEISAAMDSSAVVNVNETAKVIPIASGPHSCILVTSKGITTWGRLPKALILESQSSSTCASLSMKLDQLSLSYGTSSVYENVSYATAMPTLPLSLKLPKEILGGHQIRQVACGVEHSVVLSQAGQIYGIGINRFGQLGCGDRHNRYEFTRIEVFHQNGKRMSRAPLVSSIVSGLYHSIALAKTSPIDPHTIVFTWGWSVHGQLGIPKLTRDCLVPTTVPTFLLSNEIEVVQASAGHCHSLFLTNDGRIYGCGNNTYGQLGLGNLRKAVEPRLIDLEAFVNMHEGEKL